MKTKQLLSRLAKLGGFGMVLMGVSSAAYATGVTPLPEPTTLALLAGGVAAVIVASRFTRRK